MSVRLTDEDWENLEAIETQTGLEKVALTRILLKALFDCFERNEVLTLPLVVCGKGEIEGLPESSAKPPSPEK